MASDILGMTNESTCLALLESAPEGNVTAYGRFVSVLNLQSMQELIARVQTSQLVM